MIPYGRQDIRQADIDAVVDVLQSNFLTQGPVVPEFEKTVADYIGVKYAVSVNSATSALHIACLALNLGCNDLLWTSPITFVASANCALYCGAKVDFVDIDPKTYNICPNALELKLIQADKLGRLPQVVIAVHMCGQSCDMEAIYSLSLKYGFKIIEDASHAIGGKYKEEFIGSCRYSDITIFSFHPVKIITTGEGGIALTNNRALKNKMDILRSHGITRNHDEMTKVSEGPWYYEQISLGFNYRMTDLQAALGISQMVRLDEYVSRRQYLAARYNSMLNDVPILTPYQNPESYSSFHLYVVRLKLDEIRKNRREIFDELLQKRVGVNVHYIPVHLQPYYQRMGFGVGDYPEAEKYYKEAISIPIFQTLTDSQQDMIVNTLRSVVM